MVLDDELVMLVFIQTPFLVLLHSWSTVIVFMVIIPIVLLSRLTISLFTVYSDRASDLWQLFKFSYF